MKKTIIIIFILTLLLSLLTGCNRKSNSALSQGQVNEIALEAVSLSEKDVNDIHIHVTTYDEAPCYSVHITAAQEEYEVIIHGITGEVLYIGDSTH